MQSSPYPLSTADTEYLKRNTAFADKHSFVFDSIFLTVFVLIIGNSINKLRTIDSSSFQYKTEIAAILISLAVIIYISVHLSIKVKVEQLRKRK